MSKKESTPSEKAADRMHADLSAMLEDARRHAAMVPLAEFEAWDTLRRKIFEAKSAATQCMSERDRRVARSG
jgi:hypothetical protein